jgi:hypothetical protein
MADSNEKKAQSRIAAAKHACGDCERFFQCCLCKFYFAGYGHNARPVKDGRCCEGCNFDHVIPERMRWVMEEWDKES